MPGRKARATRRVTNLIDLSTRMEYLNKGVHKHPEMVGEHSAMSVYYGSGESEHVKVVRDLGCGAGETSCLECDGSGKWPFAPYAVHPDSDCVDCKGTGKVLVSVA